MIEATKVGEVGDTNDKSAEYLEILDDEIRCLGKIAESTLDKLNVLRAHRLKITGNPNPENFEYPSTSSPFDIFDMSDDSEYYEDDKEEDDEYLDDDDNNDAECIHKYLKKYIDD